MKLKYNKDKRRESKLASSTRRPPERRLHNRDLGPERAEHAVFRGGRVHQSQEARRRLAAARRRSAHSRLVQEQEAAHRFADRAQDAVHRDVAQGGARSRHLCH